MTLTTLIPARPVTNHNAHPAAIDVRNLTVRYNGDAAIDDVTFRVMAGDKVAIIGPNGAGKSTLIKAILGLLRYQSGQITVAGDLATLGYVPQHEDVNWNFPVTVRDVVMMGSARRIGWLRRPSRADWQRVDSALERVDMAAYGRRQVGELSGGQRRRVFIARALAQNADTLLLDEPFSGVDTAAETDIFQVLDVLRDEGVAVLLATHNLVQAATHYDKLMLLNSGRMLAYGPPAQVYTPDNLAATFGERIALVREGDRYLVIPDQPCHDHDHDDQMHRHSHSHRIAS